MKVLTGLSGVMCHMEARGMVPPASMTSEAWFEYRQALINKLVTDPVLIEIVGEDRDPDKSEDRHSWLQYFEWCNKHHRDDGSMRTELDESRHNYLTLKSMCPLASILFGYMEQLFLDHEVAEYDGITYFELYYDVESVFERIKVVDLPPGKWIYNIYRDRWDDLSNEFILESK